MERSKFKVFGRLAVLLTALCLVFGGVASGFVGGTMVAFAEETPAPVVIPDGIELGSEAEWKEFKKYKREDLNEQDQKRYDHLKSKFDPNSYEEALKEQKDSEVLNNLADGIKPGQNAITNLIMSPVNTVANSVLYIVLGVINLYFFIQTALDIFFLLAPSFREWLSGHQDEDGGAGKAAQFCNKLVSEAALNAVGYSKTQGNKGHITAGDMAPEVKWGEWVSKRLIMFVFLMTYIALLMLGLLGDVVSFFTRLGGSIIEALLDLFDPGLITSVFNNFRF